MIKIGLSLNYQISLIGVIKINLINKFGNYRKIVIFALNQYKQTMAVITTHKISTNMGIVSSHTKLDFLTETQQKEFDSIGYRGKKLDDTEMGRVEYLNSIDKNIQYELHQIKYDNGNFNEEFILVRVVLAQK